MLELLEKILSAGGSRITVETGDWLHLTRDLDLGLKLEACVKGLRYSEVTDTGLLTI